jgi:hypothetical protein
LHTAAYFVAMALLAAPAPALADDEASNTPTVVASEHGNCYAKSVPASAYGNDGLTNVYAVDSGSDRLVATYNWYASTMRLECNVAAANGHVGVSVVQFGPWPRGSVANAETLAFAFYRDGQLLRRYSTLDVAGRPDNVSASVSHYTVVDTIIGYSWLDGNRYAFAVRSTDGRVLRFDAGTGEVLPAD